ncbi:hypothetical protein N7522_006226 [Penicillium canescens]|nr:hypothetical protein N7522_006226 [Penicillium canescens]
MPLQFKGSRSKVPHLETDSSPKHRLQEDEPLRKTMLSFLRTQLGQSGGQSVNRDIIVIIILHDNLPYGFLFTQPRCEDSDELCSLRLPTKTTRTTDE